MVPPGRADCYPAEALFGNTPGDVLRSYYEAITEKDHDQFLDSIAPGGQEWGWM